eukprot:2466013-Pyramimonas_sp.AAC.1
MGLASLRGQGRPPISLPLGVPSLRGTGPRRELREPDPSTKLGVTAAARERAGRPPTTRHHAHQRQGPLRAAPGAHVLHVRALASSFLVKGGV